MGKVKDLLISMMSEEEYEFYNSEIPDEREEYVITPEMVEEYLSLQNTNDEIASTEFQ